MAFVTLQKGNDHGVEYWAVQPLRSGTEAHAMRGIKVLDGETVHIRMANQNEFDATVVAQSASTTGTDDGHGHPAQYRTLSFNVPIGQGVNLPPQSLDVDQAWVISRTVEG